MAKAKSTPKPIKNEPSFKISIKMNDSLFETSTDNLEEYISSLKPYFLKTKVIITVEKEGKKVERMLIGFPAKQLFRNGLFLRNFIKKLSFK